LQTFHLIDSQRVHFRDGVRVHGYVINGGQAVNIIPELAVAEFSVRALDTVELARVQAIVERCARGAAMAAGVKVTIAVRESYKDLVNNLTMARCFGAHLESLGRKPAETDAEMGAGSTDMGDVSHAVPSIHPWIGICTKGETTCHQHAFQACAGSERGAEGMLVAAKAMALTTADLLADAGLRAEVKREFEARRRG
jgi:metal-dependent amidase/aminoacylase/carboxypeptidase family protein